LCFKCGKKYSLGHKCLESPADASQAQLIALESQEANGGDLLSEVVLDALEMHSALNEESCYLSINVVVGTQNSKVIHLRALVNNQVLSILVDSGSSHTFLNVDMISRLQCVVSPAKQMVVKVANGQMCYLIL
jgi:hypothetical protein